jgi:hypothetical protein
MKLNAYSVKDLQVLAFLPPFYARTNGEAGRNFIQAVGNGGLKATPTDYELYYIGKFNDESGRLEPEEPQYLTNGHEALKIWHEQIQANRPRTIQEN